MPPQRSEPNRSFTSTIHRNRSYTTRRKGYENIDVHPFGSPDYLSGPGGGGVRWPPQTNPTSWSSGAMTSASPMSAAYSFGMMGFKTPSIDRIAKDGMMFTDYYAEQSCTAGRSTFITGQLTARSGLSKVGMPAAKQGMPEDTVTLAAVLKNMGYATGQFGKNHLGDRNEHLPTVHGFDEFYGNLYHLNAEEEPELPDYPKNPQFKEKFGPRGVMDCVATDKFDKTEDPRWGVVGKQFCKDTAR